MDRVIANALKGFDSMHVFPVRMNLPFSHSGILIYKSSSHVKVTAKHGLVAMWNEDDSFTVSMTSICKIPDVSCKQVAVFAPFRLNWIRCTRIRPADCVESSVASSYTMSSSKMVNNACNKSTLHF